MSLTTGLSLLSLMACNDLIEQPPPSFASLAEVCEPDAATWADSTAASPGRGGSSTAILSFGTSSADEDQNRFAAIGIPGPTASDSYSGSVDLLWADVALGELDTLSSFNQTLSPPTGRSGYSYGASLLAADVTECSRPTHIGAPEMGCGEELLVGSPDYGSHSEGGRVHFYQSDGSTGTNTLYTYAGDILDPTGSLGGHFGASIAKAPAVFDIEYLTPWEKAGDYPLWVAVGAPGDGRVEIFEVDPYSTTFSGSPTPFVHVQTVLSPWVGIEFGHALTVGDFNGDLVPDLAVGAPGFPSGGAVYVYKGNLSGPPLSANGLELLGSPLPGPSHNADEFGYALDSGRTFSGDLRESIVIGAPGYGAAVALADQGGLCQARLLNSPTPSGLSVQALDCWGNPDSIAGERFGHSVRLGDFGAVDGNGSIYTDAAVLRDTAVGRPGYNSGDGRVSVYFSDDQGTDLNRELATFTDPSAASGSEFGTAISSGYIQETTWSDMLVGAPGANTNTGLAALTLAGNVSSTRCDLEGYWTVTYEKADLSTTTDATMMIWLDSSGNPVLNFSEGFRLNLVDNSTGSPVLCEDDIIDPDDLFGDKIHLRSSFFIEPGMSFETNDTCANAATSGTSWEWTGVPFGSVVASFLTTSQWNYLTGLQQTNVLATTATISATVVSTSPRVIEFDADVDWAALWSTLPGGFPDDCDTLAGLPYSAEQYRDSVCED